MQRPLISIRTVIAKVVRDLNLGGTEIPWQDMVEWMGEALQHIGAIGQLEPREVDLDVDGYRAKLPCDFYSAPVNNHLAYRIRGDNLLVGFESGTVTGFRYLAFPVDDEGFPLVPDHISYTTALFWKVAMQLAIRNQLPNKELTFAICKGRWDWYCTQAGAVGQALDNAGRARYAAFFTSMVPVNTHYAQAFSQVSGDVPLLNPLPSPATRNVIPMHWVPTPAEDTP